MNNDPVRTAAWMTAENVQGTPEEIVQYARDWIEVRTTTGVALRIRERIPSRAVMDRQAERIVREKTRTRVIGGYRVYVQARENMTFGRDFGVPGVCIGMIPTSDPETENWEVVPAGEFDYNDDPELRIATLQAPVRYQYRDNARNQLGQMGASVAIWPDAETWERWLIERIGEMIGEGVPA